MEFTRTEINIIEMPQLRKIKNHIEFLFFDDDLIELKDE